jgi:hypothetical protein
MPCGEDKQRIATRRPAFPTDDHPPLFLLKPGTGPRRLAARHVLCQRVSPGGLGLPPPVRALGTSPPLPKLLSQGGGLLSCVRRQDLAPLPWSPRAARADRARLQQRQALGPLLPLGRRRTMGNRPARRLRQRVEEKARAFATPCAALPAALARGNRSRQPLPSAPAAGPVPRRSLAAAPASRPGGHRAARAAATEAPRFSTPPGDPGGDRTHGSQCCAHTTRDAPPGALGAVAGPVPASGEEERGRQKVAMPTRSNLRIVLP